MNKPLFSGGITGLSDSKHSGSRGNVYRSVGVDFRSNPGTFKAHQKLKKISSTFAGEVETNVVTELCKNVVDVSNSTKLWFSSESGKIWQQTNDTFALVHTIVPMTDYTEVSPTMAITLGNTALPLHILGLILNPSGSVVPELVVVKSNTIAGASSTISSTVTIPNESDMLVLVMAGTYNNNSISGITFDGNAMTGILGDISNSGAFYLGWSAKLYKNPSAGSKTITATFNASVTNRYIYVLVFKGVHQTSTIAGADEGFVDISSPGLVGTANNQLRVAIFASSLTTHTHTTTQNNNVLGMQQEIIKDDTGTVGTQSIAIREFVVGTAKTISATEFGYTQEKQLATSANNYEFKLENNLNKIYYTNENVLFAIDVDKISTWGTDVESIGGFINGDSTYHPMVKQNLELFIGDKINIAKVNTNGTFIQETSFNIKSPERIQAITSFDIDILVGTKETNKARILRWDGASDSWSAEDDVFEAGVNAFVKDDNYTYVSAGDYGRLYFYNGEKLELVKRIPGTWDSTHKAIINENSVGFLNGIPVFGLSNNTGNPTLQGVYGFGSYDNKYSKSLSLDFPLPTNEFEGISLGAILTNGVDMWLSYKTATDVGIARIDHENKYTGAYIETMMLTYLRDRNTHTIEEGICVDYISKPTGTSITIGTKTKYDTNYTSQTVVTDTAQMSVRTKKSIPKIVSLQARIGLVPAGNNSPEVENIGLI